MHLSLKCCQEIEEILVLKLYHQVSHNPETEIFAFMFSPSHLLIYFIRVVYVFITSV
jgi:hypothetical protein